MQRRQIVFLLLAVLAGLAVWGAFSIDKPVREAIVSGQGKGWKKSAEARFHATVRKLGDWPPLMAAAAAVLLFARLRRNKKWCRILVAAMVASTLAGILANASRLTTGRTRPRESPRIEQGFYGLRHEGKWIVGNSGFNSFPSGHTATAFGFAFGVLFAAPAWGIVVLAGAVVVAWSSLAIGAHHPSDVLVSILLSGLVAWGVTRWMASRGGNLLDQLLRMPNE